MQCLSAAYHPPEMKPPVHIQDPPVQFHSKRLQGARHRHSDWTQERRKRTRGGDRRRPGLSPRAAHPSTPLPRSISHPALAATGSNAGRQHIRSFIPLSWQLSLEHTTLETCGRAGPDHGPWEKGDRAAYFRSVSLRCVGVCGEVTVSILCAYMHT